ncbi:putative ubiquitin-like-specific protease 1B isoform X1 [Iris pallida]|uniref:Ubiquitin-like-specific protease 1B isoform X1 n=1 Tax=Iris pallida TaxID=29817 RepID=A0AAX6EXG6_IRIPA|nr:putative ubiquitin-like-specific protease 1B isoform X1 [Iris pallida]
MSSSMGALTDTRKRRLSDLHLPADSSTTKKQPKLHGPQQIVRPFRSGSSRNRIVQAPSFSRMGNFLSGLFKSRREYKKKKKKRKKKSKKNGDFDLVYRELVAESGCWNIGLGLLGLSSDQESGSARTAVSRKVEKARRVVESAAAAVKETFFVRKRSVCKELHELSKLSILEFKQKPPDQKLLAIRPAQKASEKEKEDLHELFCQLTDEEMEVVSYALRGGSSHELLVTHEASNIEITREVIRCLDCGAWLNDEVINLYLELLKERERREPKRFLKCHFFNTFFYRKLISGKNGYDFNGVRRWTTKRKLGYSLIECDKIFVPIHKDTHWCLAVINVKDETFQYLDSLGGMDTSVLRVLTRYFMDEVKDKSDEQFHRSAWKQETVYKIPIQKNGFDCGMFMLKYIDFYSRGLGLCFSQKHMGYFRKRTAMEILRLRAE